MQVSHQRIAYKRLKSMIIGLRENNQNSEKFDSETSNLQPVNLSETSSTDTAGVHQRVAHSLQSFNVSSF